MSPLEQFTKVTVNVVQKDGLDGYLPTLMFPATKTVRVIEGIPADIDHRNALQQIIVRDRLHLQEFFFGVQTAGNEITTGHYTPDHVSFMTIIQANDGYLVRVLDKCTWWRIHSN
jgi:hypothetical protein